MHEDIPRHSRRRSVSKPARQVDVCVSRVLDLRSDDLCTSMRRAPLARVLGSKSACQEVGELVDSQSCTEATTDGRARM